MKKKLGSVECPTAKACGKETTDEKESKDDLYPEIWSKGY